MSIFLRLVDEVRQLFFVPLDNTLYKSIPSPAVRSGLNTITPACNSLNYSLSPRREEYLFFLVPVAKCLAHVIQLSVVSYIKPGVIIMKYRTRQRQIWPIYTVDTQLVGASRLRRGSLRCM